LSLIDDIKVFCSATIGVGNWWIETIDVYMKIAVSFVTVIYIILKCVKLLKNK